MSLQKKGLEVNLHYWGFIQIVLYLRVAINGFVLMLTNGQIFSILTLVGCLSVAFGLIFGESNDI